jgi:hypothetical protein
MSPNLVGIAGIPEIAGPLVAGYGPMGLVGRFAGLGADELEAGVPGWAWMGVGVVVGVVAAYSLHDRLQAFIER